MRVTPFRLIPDRELRRLETLLSPVVMNWCHRWLDVDGALKLVAVTREEDWSNESKGELWHWEWSVENRCVMRLGTNVRRKWLSMMLRSNLAFDVETDITTELWSRSASELVEAALGANGGKSAAAPVAPTRSARVASDWLRPGSGIVRVQLAGELGTMELLMPVSNIVGVAVPQMTEHADGRGRERLLESSLRNQSLHAEMIFASEELALGELLSLQIGDVIALNQRCDEPVNLTIKDTDVVVAGYLGQLHGTKALVVSSAKPDA